MPDPVFTDIHCHPELKTFLSADHEVDRFDCWQNLNLKPLLQIIDRILLGNILVSQSSLSQLSNVTGTIAYSGLYAIEKAMVNGDLINLLGKHVNLVDTALILKKLGYLKVLDYDLMKRISSPQTSYFDLFKEEQAHLVKSETIYPGYNPMNLFGDYKSDKLNLVFTIEGGHNLFNSTVDSSHYGNVLQNLRDLKGSGHRYLFMGLAHLERNPLCTHAYGMKLLQHNDFMPVNHDITVLGREVIKVALEKPKRILIDIKHMSIEARKQYYEILETDYSSEKIPILISHGGVTGVSWDNKPVTCRKKYRDWIKVRYFKPKGLMGTKFNPWSINLYDEEIKKIVDSDGLIGLNLDERILGAKQKRPGERVEYFSPEEFNRRDFRLQLLRSICSWGQADLITEEERQAREIELQIRRLLIEYIRDIIRNPNRIIDADQSYQDILNLYNQLLTLSVHISEKGIKHLCNNILHIIRVTGDAGWKHISIGSDLDGLVNSVDSCANASQYDALAQGLVTWIPAMADTIQGFPPITNINQKIYDIMSGNAYTFLQKYFI